MTFIGPDYAAIRSRNWARVHTYADRREPLDFAPNAGRWLGEQDVRARGLERVKTVPHDQ